MRVAALALVALLAAPSSCAAGAGGRRLRRMGRHRLAGAGGPRRLFIISPVHAAGAEKAAALERRWAKVLAPGLDGYANVCGFSGSGCRAIVAARAEAAGLRLLNLVELPRTSAEYLLGGIGDCNHSAADRAYLEGQMKFTAGLVEQVRSLKATGGGMPQWWLIKDADTYVNVPNLFAAVREAGAGAEGLVALGHLQGVDPRTLPTPKSAPWPKLAGGGGVLLSGPLAELLALEHGEAWIRAQAEALASCSWRDVLYDSVLTNFVRRNIREAEIRDLPALQALRLDSDPCTHLISPPCSHGYRLKHCLCARSPRPATWHMTSGFRPGAIPWEEALEYADDS